MQNRWRLIILATALLLICSSNAKVMQKGGPKAISNNKIILMVIAHENYRDEEYAIPKAAFEQAGYKVVTASTQLGTATGKLGMKTKVDITLDQVKVNDYAAVLFIGGPGSFDLYENKTCHKIAQETIAQGKILGAICAAPGILAHAGVLKGKKATMFDDTGVIGQFGGIYTGKEVEVNGNIISATGPHTAKAWAEAIIKHGKS